MKHSNALLMLKGLTEDQEVIARSAAEALVALVESDIPKGLMEQKFYAIHDGMINELHESLDEADAMALIAEVPGGGTKFETWVRKEMQKRFSIPDPLDYELEG